MAAKEDLCITVVCLCVECFVAGATLVPISWSKMQCPRTLAEEFRKVARVQPEFLEYSET